MKFTVRLIFNPLRVVTWRKIPRSARNDHLASGFHLEPLGAVSGSSPWKTFWKRNYRVSEWRMEIGR